MAKNEEALLKKSLKEEKVVFGTKQTLDLLKKAKLKKVYLSSNCPEKIVSDVEHYGKLAKIEIVKLDKPNDELGIFCKKPFSISMLGLR